MPAVRRSQCGRRGSATSKGPKTHPPADWLMFSCAPPPSSHLHTRSVFDAPPPPLPSSHLHTRSVFTQDSQITVQCRFLASPRTALAVPIAPECLRELPAVNHSSRRDCNHSSRRGNCRQAQLPPRRQPQLPPRRRAAKHSSRRGANHSSRRGAVPPTTAPAAAPKLQS